MLVTGEFAYTPPAIKCKQLDDGAVLPQKSKEGDACFDLYPKKPEIINPGERLLVMLGFSIAIPKGFEGVIRGRSGLASKSCVDAHLGTIDSNYREEVGVLLINNSKRNAWHIGTDTRIAQLGIREVPEFRFVWADQLDETDRKGGFGSSGGMGSMSVGGAFLRNNLELPRGIPTAEGEYQMNFEAKE